MSPPVPSIAPVLARTVAAGQDGKGIYMLQAVWNGRIVAESADTIRVEGNHYFPPDSLRREHFIESGRTSICPWKGKARYFDVVVEDKVNPAAAWYYPKPTPLARRIRGHVAFGQGIQVREVGAGTSA